MDAQTGLSTSWHLYNFVDYRLQPRDDGSWSVFTEEHLVGWVVPAARCGTFVVQLTDDLVPDTVEMPTQLEAIERLIEMHLWRYPDSAG
jgi:hypothetical protein